MSKRKHPILKGIAILTAIAGAAVAIGSFFEKKAKDIGKQLDYDASLYYDDDDDFNDLTKNPDEVSSDDLSEDSSDETGTKQDD